MKRTNSGDGKDSATPGPVSDAMEERIRRLAMEELSMDALLDDDIYTPVSLWDLSSGLIEGHTDVDAHYVDADGPPLP